MAMRILWHRLLTNPRTHVESADGDATRLKVEGLACDAVCVRRTRKALLKLEGVRRVSVDLDDGIATIEGAQYPADVYERVVTSQVAGKPVRRLIERVAAAVRSTQPAREARA